MISATGWYWFQPEAILYWLHVSVGTQSLIHDSKCNHNYWQQGTKEKERTDDVFLEGGVSQLTRFPPPPLRALTPPSKFIIGWPEAVFLMRLVAERVDHASPDLFTECMSERGAHSAATADCRALCPVPGGTKRGGDRHQDYMFSPFFTPLKRHRCSENARWGTRSHRQKTWKIIRLRWQACSRYAPIVSGWARR